MDIGGTRILMQGGHNPNLPWSYYTDLLTYLRTAFPRVEIDGFSPSELIFFSKTFKRPVRELLAELHEAGLTGLPGGGAEILDNDVRAMISPLKNSWEGWIDAIRAAQELGMPTTSTMVIGFGETNRQRLLHLQRVRDLQDERVGHGFTAHIVWTFQDENTELRGGATAVEYLRMQALGRIFLDTIPNVQASWVTQGRKVGQIALSFGANDFGSTMMEENVVSSAGAEAVKCILSEDDIVRLIRGAGFRPAQRDTRYALVKPWPEEPVDAGQPRDAVR